MTSKVVSTKLTEEEYGKLVGLCSSTGFTVSRLLKRAILTRMNEEAPRVEQYNTEKPKTETPKPSQTKKIKTSKEEERFLYY
jgi:hypothetical protein